MVHEELRQALCSLNSPLWSTDDGKLVALCLFASIPSGADDVVNIRLEVLGNLVGESKNHSPSQLLIIRLMFLCHRMMVQR